MWLQGRGESSFSPTQMPVVGAAFVENILFSLNCLDAFIEQALIVYVWVFFLIFYYV